MYLARPLKLKSDYLNILLDVAAQRTRERGDRAYERSLGVSLRDIRLLRMIGSAPGIAMGELSAEAGLEKTLASKLVGSLVQRELVARQIGQKDARNIQLTLTEAGADLVLRAEPLGKRLEAGFQRALTKDEIEVLRRTLRKLIDAEAASRDQFEAWLEQLTEAAPG